MPVRATKRGAERTPLRGDWDVLICGASFAGLASARELAGTGARVLVIDRYEIGERQTSACGIPTSWLSGMGLEGALQQTFDELVVHTPHGTTRWPLPWSFSTFDYRTLCRVLWEQSGPETRFETAMVSGRTGDVVHTDRGDLRAPLIVDALGDRKSTRLNSSHANISYAVFCLKKKKNKNNNRIYQKNKKSDTLTHTQ